MKWIGDGSTLKNTLNAVDGLKDLDKLGFILWTGDSSRHDRDRLLPKKSKSSCKENKKVMKLVLKYLPVSRVPVIPSIGNWDVYPTSQLDPVNNNKALLKLWELWKPLFPHEESRSHETAAIKETFMKGGFFSREIIPNNLHVISLNTLSFFEENRRVGDCSPFDHNRHQISKSNIPGDVQLMWLENQLKLARHHAYKVIMIGHVPPVTPERDLYTLNCLDWFSYLSGEYADVVLMQYFGHINRDIVHLVMVSKSYDLVC